MLYMIKLELNKIQLKPYLLGFFLVNAAVISLACIVLVSLDPQDVQSVYPDYPDYSFVLHFMLTLVKMAATIMSALLISKLVIGEYMNKTILVYFLYPLPRQRLLLSKLLLIGAFVLVFILASISMSMAAFYGLNHYANFISAPIAPLLTVRFYTDILFQAINTTATGFILSLYSLE